MRLLAAQALVAFAAMASASPAWGHVTVHPNALPAGSSDVELTFRVPNERDNANTVTLQVFFPTDLPLLTVDVLPVAGWSATVHTQNLVTPIQTDDGPVTQIVSDVTWHATNGGIAPGQYEDFPVAAGSVPDHPGHLVFKALQTYSSGEVVLWIEVPVAGQPSPDTPAPVLTLTPPQASTASTDSPVASQAASSTSSSPTTEVLAGAALALATLSLLGVIWVAAICRRRS